MQSDQMVPTHQLPAKVDTGKVLAAGLMDKGLLVGQGPNANSVHIPSAVTKYVTVSPDEICSQFSALQQILLSFWSEICQTLLIRSFLLFRKIDRGTLLIQFNLNVSSSGRQDSTPVEFIRLPNFRTKQPHRPEMKIHGY